MTRPENDNVFKEVIEVILQNAGVPPFLKYQSLKR